MAELIVDANRIIGNAHALQELCARRGLTMLPVTKCFAFFTPLLNAMRQAGFHRLGLAAPPSDEPPVHPKNGPEERPVMVALPAPGKALEVARRFSASHNSEIQTIKRLAQAAASIGETHGVILMVEVGDLREGVMPEDVLGLADEIVALERRDGGARFQGVAANFACMSGLLPNDRSFGVLEETVGRLRDRLGERDLVVSVGGSVMLPWLEADALPPSATELRIGYGMILGRIPATFGDETREYLMQDSVVLEGTVLEIKDKPSLPWGDCGRDAFGKVKRFEDMGVRRRALLDFGMHDVDPDGLACLIPGVRLVGANSNCTVYDVSDCPVALRPGDSLRFAVRSYAALTRSFHSLSLAKILVEPHVAHAGRAASNGGSVGLRRR